ncbi:shikimate dehydrogenase [Pseudonocardia xishanensis]|uniref:Shikimate dehydrogenase n=1 Tax=Pseudonocardia xishanensis TaxID=630995 RepID=A0ABP8RXH6_9PSEU
MLGTPIRHSLSPVLHRAAYAALGLPEWSYEAIEVTEDGLPAFVDELGAEWAGLSLTMPLKRVALEVADSVSALAEATGAANTLVLGPQGRRADNTDVRGIVQALREVGVREIEHAVVLGAGGTAQAALAALAELGSSDPVVLVRDPRRAGGLLAAAERLDVRPAVRGLLTGADTDTEAAARLLGGADVVVSTLPAGAGDALAGARWRPGAAVLDVVYAPWPTALAAGAAVGGCRIASGLDVLLHQAVAQVELMTGLPGPVEAMRTALHAATDTAAR